MKKMYLRAIGLSFFIAFFVNLSTIQAQQYKKDIASGSDVQVFGNPIQHTQLLYDAVDLGNPSNAYIDRIYFKRGSSGAVTFNNLVISLGETESTSGFGAFATTAFYTSISEVLNISSITIPAGPVGSWFSFDIFAYPYNSASRLIVDISYTSSSNDAFSTTNSLQGGIFFDRKKLFSSNLVAANGTSSSDWEDFGLDFAPDNDNCVGAIDILPGLLCTRKVSGTTFAASQSRAASQCNGHTTASADDDVWYAFTASGLGDTVTVVATNGAFDPVVDIYRDGAPGSPCKSLIVETCADNSGAGGTETLRMLNLQAGTRYYIRIYSVNLVKSTFTLCLTNKNSPCLTPTPSIKANVTQTTSNGSVLLTLLTANPGSLIWEQSTDLGNTWTSTGQFSSVDTVLARSITSDTIYYRANTQLGNCDPAYSNIVKIFVRCATFIAIPPKAFPDYISKVKFQEIDNTSTFDPLGGAYQDFRGLTANICLGSSADLNLELNIPTGRANNNIIWIDFNHNGDFSDQGEKVFAGSRTNTTSLSIPIFIPSNATPGNTTMRVLSFDDTESQSGAGPCDDGFYLLGEIEEYTVNLRTLTVAEAGTGGSNCGTSRKMNANTIPDGLGTWSIYNGIGTGVFGNIHNPTTTVTGMSTGLNVFRWTASNSFCPSNSDTVQITVNLPFDADAGTDVEACTSAVFVTGNTPPVGSTASWTLLTGNGSVFPSGNNGGRILYFTSGISTLKYSVTVPGCPASLDTVMVEIKANPSNAVAGNDSVICGSTFTMKGNTPLVGQGTWKLVSGAGTFSDIHNPNAVVSGLLPYPAINTFLWTIKNDPCLPDSDYVSLGVNLPGTAFAGSDQTVCSTATTLTGSAKPQGFTYTTGSIALFTVRPRVLWTQITGSSTIASPDSAITNVSNLSSTNTYIYSVFVPRCGTTTDTIVVNRAFPPFADAGYYQDVCDDTTHLQASGGNGTWKRISGSGTVVNPTNPNSKVIGLAIGDNVFQWKVTNPPCAPDSDQVTINRRAPILVNAGTNASVCSTAVVLQADTAGDNGGSWVLISGSGTISPFNNGKTAVISGLAVGANVFEYSSSFFCGFSKDTIVVTRFSPPVATAGNNQTVCANTATLNATSPAAGTGRWTRVSGAGSITNPLLRNTTVTGLGSGNNVFKWKVTNAPCPADSDNVTINYTPISNPFAGEDVAVCTTSVTLTGSARGIATATWTQVGGSASISPFNNGQSAFVNGLAAGVNTFVYTLSSGGCPSKTDTIVVTRRTPQIADAGSNQVICANSTTLAAIVPAEGSGQWARISGTGSIQSSTSASTAVSGLGLGNNVFQWKVSNDPCPADSATVTITVNTIINANAGTDQVVCTTFVVVAGNVPPTNGTSRWTRLTGAGLVNSPNSRSTTISSLGIGVNTFEYKITVPGCGETKDTVAITRVANPTTAIAGQNQSVCYDTTTLSGNTPVTGTGTWTVVSGTGSFSDIHNPSAHVTGLSTGNNIFQWSIASPPCSTSSQNVTINRIVPVHVDLGPDVQVCSTAISLTANTTGADGGSWSLISGSGTLSVSNGGLNVDITGLAAGNNTFEYSAPAQCGKSKDTITVRRFVPPVANAGNNQTVCTTSATLSATAPANGAGRWTLVSGTGTIQNPLLRNTGVTNLSLGNNVFKWKVTNAPCPADSDNVTINYTPISNPFAGQDEAVCTTFVSLTGSARGTATATWTQVGGSATISPFNNGESAFVNGLSAGINTFVYTLSSSGCTSRTDTVVVTQMLPPVANAGTGKTVCTSTTSLGAAAPANGTGRWTLVSGGGTIQNPNVRNTNVSNLSPGNNVFQWKVTNTPCPADSASVTIIYSPLIDNPFAGNDVAVCTTSVTLNGSTRGTATATWAQVGGSATVSLFNNGESAFITGLSAGVNTFVYTLNSAGCGSSTDTILVTRAIQPLANAGSDRSICTSSVTLNATAPTNGTGRWSLVSGSGTIQNPLLRNTNVTNLGTGNNVFKWKVTNAPCPADSATVTINYTPLNNPFAGNDITVCSTAISLVGSNRGTATATWTQNGGSATISPFNNGQSAVINGLVAGANEFVYTLSSVACGSKSDTIIVTRATPQTANAGSDQTICASSTNLGATNPTQGSGLWSLVSGSGTVQNPSVATSLVTGLGLGINVFQWKVSNDPCPADSATIKITVNSIVTALAGPDQVVCTNLAAITVTGNNVPVNGTSLWSRILGAGVVNSPNSKSTTISGIGVGINTFEYRITVPGCGVTRDTVLITGVASPTTANSGPAQTVCVDHATLAANTPAIGQGTWTVMVGSGTFENIHDPTTEITGLAAGNNVLMWEIKNPPCFSSFQTTSVTYNVAETVDLGPDVEICSTAISLTADVVGINGGTWTLLSGSGTISTFSNGQNAVINGLASGQNVFEYQTFTECGTIMDTIIVTRFVPPVADAGENRTVCSASVSLNAANPADGTGRWTRVSGSGTIQNPTNRNSTVTGLGIGNNVFKWKVTNAPCAPDSDLVTITRIAPIVAIAGPDQSISTNSTTLAGGNPSGVWSLFAGAGNISQPTNPSSALTSLGLGANSFIWTVTNSPCPVSRDTVTIRVNQVNNPCNEVMLTAQATVGLAGKVKVEYPSGSIISVYRVDFGDGIKTSLIDDTTTLTYTYNMPGVYNVCGTFYYLNALQETDSCTVCDTIFIHSPINPCDSLTITPGTVVKEIVTSPDDSSGYYYNFQTTFNFPAGYFSKVGVTATDIGTGILTVAPDATFAQIKLTFTPGAKNVCFKAYFTNNQGLPDSCVKCFDYTFDFPPVCDFFKVDVKNECGNQASAVVHFSAQSPVDNFIVDFGDGFTHTGNTAGDSVVHSFTTPGQHIICAKGYYNQGLDSCMVCDTVQINVASDAGSDQNICVNFTNMAANSPSTGTGTWTRISGAGTIADIHDPNSVITGLGLGENIFRWTFSNAPCTDDFQDVTINVNSIATAIAGSDQILTTNSTNFTGGNPTGIWTLLSGSGTIVNPSSPISLVTGMSMGLNSFIWTVSNQPCPASSDTVNITVNEVASPCSLVTVTASHVAGLDLNVQVEFIPPLSILSYRVNFDDAFVSIFATDPAQFQHTYSNPGIYNVCAEFTYLNALGNQVTCQVCDTVLIPIPVNPCDSLTITPGAVVKEIVTSPDDVSGWYYSFPTAFNFPAGYFSKVGVTATDIGTGILTVAPDATFAEINLTFKPGVKNVCFKGYFTNNQGLPDSCMKCFDYTFDFPPVCDFFKVDVKNECGNKASAVVHFSAQSPVDNFVVDFGDGFTHSGTAAGDSVVHNFTNPGQHIICTKGYYNQGLDSCMVCDTVMIDEMPNAGIDQVTCQNFATLTGNGNLNEMIDLQKASSVSSVVWTLIGGSGTIVTPNDFTTLVTGLGFGINTFEYRFTSPGCPDQADTIAVTRFESPTQTNAGPDDTICLGGVATLSATVPNIGTGHWEVVTGAGQIQDILNPNTTVSNLSAGINTFKWIVINAPCPSDSDEVNILVNEPFVVFAGTDDSTCQNFTTLIGNAGFETASKQWTVVSGTGSFLNPNSNSTQVTDLSLGINQFALSVLVPGCPINSDTIAITFLTPVENANAGPESVVCSESTVLAGILPQGHSGKWTIFSGNGTFEDDTNPTTSVTGIGVGYNVFQWTISNACGSTFDTVTIQRLDTLAQPIAGADQILCSTLTQLNAVAPNIGAGQWSLVSGAGQFVNASNATTVVNNLGTGENILRWTVSNAPCQSKFDDVSITVNESVAANAGVNDTICDNQYNLTGNQPSTNAGINWTVIAGGGQLVSPNASQTSVIGLSVGVNTFKYSITENGCNTLSDTVSILRSDSIATPNAGQDQIICSPNVSLSANTITVGTGLWTLVSGSGQIANPTAAQTSVTGLSLGENVFRWTVSNNPCTDKADEVRIVVNEQPNASAGGDITICADSAILVGSIPSLNSTPSWSTIIGAGTLSDPFNQISKVSGLSSGQNGFIYTLSTPGCLVSDDTVFVNRSLSPNAAAGQDQTICSATSQLNATVPLNGAGTWTLVSGSGQIANPNSAQTQVTGLQTGVNTFRWIVENAPCEPDSDDVSITVNQIVSAEAGPSSVVCDQTGTLSAVAVSGLATGSWSVVSTGPSVQDPSAASTSAVNLVPGINIFRWTVTVAGCVPSTDTVSIVRKTPIQPAAGPDQVICANIGTLAGSAPASGSGTWTVLSGGGIVTEPTNPTSAVTGLQTGQNQFVWTVTNAPCPSTSDTVEIKVNQSYAANAGSSSITCTDTGSLAAIGVPAGINGFWTVLTGGGVLTNATSDTTNATQLSLGLNTFQWNVNVPGCALVTDTLSIIRVDFSFDLGIDTIICVDSTLLLTVPPGFTNFVWSNGTTSPTYLVSGADTVVLTITTPQNCTFSDTIRVAVAICTAVDPLLTISGFSASFQPNPAGESVHLTMKATNPKQVDLQIINALGQVVYSESRMTIGMEQDKQLDVSRFAPGLYHIQIQGEGILWTQKLVVRH